MNDRIAELERIAAARTAEVLDDADPHVAAQPHDDDVEDPAGERLQAADEILRQARELTATTMPAPDERADFKTRLARLTDRLRGGVDALYEGDTDTAVNALAEAVTPDVKALAAEVVREVDLQAGMERFKRHHPEILKDPHLAAMADSHYFAARRAGKGEGEALDEAGDKTIEHLRRAAASMGIVRDAGELDALDESDASSVIAEMAAGRPSHSVG